MNLLQQIAYSGEMAYLPGFYSGLTRSWVQFMEFLDSHPPDKVDTTAISKKMRISLNDCHLRSQTELTGGVLEDLKQACPDNPITLISFFGVSRANQSYPIHKDSMDVFYVQELGNVSLYANDERTGRSLDEVLTPGDAVWLPRGTHHCITPLGTRVGLSFGVEGDKNPTEYLK